MWPISLFLQRLQPRGMQTSWFIPWSESRGIQTQLFLQWFEGRGMRILLFSEWRELSHCCSNLWRQWLTKCIHFSKCYEKHIKTHVLEESCTLPHIFLQVVLIFDWKCIKIRIFHTSTQKPMPKCKFWKKGINFGLAIKLGFWSGFEN